MITLLGKRKIAQEIKFIRERFLHDPVFQAWIQRAFRLEISDELIYDEAKSIDSPTFIIWGDSDETIPIEHCKHLESNISKAKLHIIPGGTHHLPSKNFQSVSDLILSFIDSVENIDFVDADSLYR